MAFHTRTTAAATTVALRVLTFIFLRMVAFPPLMQIIFTLFAIYIPAFCSNYIIEPEYELVDQVDIDVTAHIENEDEVVRGETDEAIVVEDIVVEETIAPVKRYISPLETLLLGTPNPNSLLSSAATFLINAACVAMVTDMVFTPRWSHPSHDLSFARVGYVSDTEAKLLIREPDQAKMPISVEVHIKDAVAPFDNTLWQTAGGIRWTTNETDYTSVVSIPLGHPDQRVYEWRTSNNHSGEFTSAPKPGRMPDLNDGKFTFLSTSCIVPRLPYNPLDHPLSFPGMKHLAKVLPTLGAQFMLFLGDFIYIDVPRRFGDRTENYRQKYRHVYASPDWPTVGQNLSWIHVLDDHEILNDWDAKSSGVYENAVDPWHHYQTAVNPPRAKRSKTSAVTLAGEPTYFSFMQGPASFFMWDTRSYRSLNAEPFDDETKTMLGEAQLEDFLEWLAQPVPKGVKWKIIASSIPFTKNWRVNTRDTWGGFLAERKKVLEAMWDASQKLDVGIVILSGDRHEFGATAFPPPRGGAWPESATVHEFSASPLNQFYSPIGTYKQTDNEDVELKYINVGNTKFGSITIENHAGGDQSSLTYNLYIGGERVWDIELLSPLVTPADKASRSLWEKLRGV